MFIIKVKSICIKLRLIKGLNITGELYKYKIVQSWMHHRKRGGITGGPARISLLTGGTTGGPASLLTGVPTALPEKAPRRRTTN